MKWMLKIDSNVFFGYTRFLPKYYSLFGNVVSFDTTYKTNKYLMIFASFTRVNHHRQCITFGATFLANEKDDDSIVWLFEKFIEAMVRKQPSIIITYQD